jgi:hypothetical protein
MQRDRPYSTLLRTGTAFCLPAVCSVAAWQSVAAEPRPNIVMIVPDDMQ